MKEKKIQKLLSLILSVFMVFSVMTVPAFAAPTDNAAPEPSAAAEAADTDADKASEQTDKADKKTTAEDDSDKDQKSDTISVEENFGTYKVNANDIDVSDVGTGVVLVDEDTKIDTDDPEIITIEEELKEITVLNDEGKSVALTEEQIQTILYLYGQYLDQWKANADVLGVQQPFFLQYNDKGEDGLGILGEMLVLATKTVDQVRSGEYSYDDLVGMIQNFLYADKFGIEFYGKQVKASRDEVMKAVKESGAKTEAQKILVINDWLAHNCEFDMAYIMNMDRDEPLIVAENPQKHEHYDEIYDEMYTLYEDQIKKQFHDQIYEGVKAQLRQQYYEGAIRKIIYTQALGGTPEEEATDEQKQAANDAAEQYMTANADAISEDAIGFITEKFGKEAADQISAGAVDFIKDAEKNGVEVDPVNAPGKKMTIEEITQQQMGQPLEDLGGMTPNEAIPVFAKQAAEGLTNGIIGAWLGNHFGVLAEGTAVCAGYSKAFSYLMQYMHPEVYGVNGAKTDMSVADNWKTSEDLYYDENGNIDINKGYIVDMVRITFDASVTMYGETAENFGADHFWNAVNVDGQWYYVDPCYTDIYVECMSRDRVEMDGTMNHLYFMFSHDTALEMYNGNMKEINGLYAEAANDTKYESSWYSRVASNAYSDGSNFYYLYDSTDMLSIMREFNKEDQSQIEYDKLQNMKDAEYKLVRHEITDKDIVSGKDGDSDYDTLIEFNYKANEDDDATVSRVYNPENGEMEENELLTELFAQFKEECEIYPSIKLTTALYDGKLYFNLSNCILSYDLASGAVELVKEYNTVYAKRDNTVAFGGMGFDVVDKRNADFTVKDHPIAAMTIKEDGQMYVSIATNFAFISGKDPHNFEDSSSFGYEFEETNYNPNYSNYFDTSEYSDEQLAQMGYTRETNDNDEFMWSGVFVDTLAAKEFTDSEQLTKDALHDEHTHHYVKFEEEYYTKDDNKNWNTGECYVCTICKRSVSEPTEPQKNSFTSNEDYEKQKAQYEKDLAEYNEVVKIAGHTYIPSDAEWSEDNSSVEFSALECSSVCPERQKVLDCLLGDETIAVTLKEKGNADAEITGHEGDCTEGATAIYTAKGEAEGYAFTATKKVQLEPGKHAYKGEFTWAEDNKSAKATLACEICGNEVKDVDCTIAKDEENSKAPTCTEAGEDILIATATVKDADNKEIGTATESKKIEIPAKGHAYQEPTFDWADDFKAATATFVCANDETHKETVDCNVTPETEDATCTEKGTITYTAVAVFNDTEFKEAKTVDAEALGHDYEAKFVWDDDNNANATITCKRCDDSLDTETTTVYDEDNSEPASYVAAGKDVYIATATATDAEGNPITEKEIREVKIDKLNANASLTKTSVSVLAGDKVTVNLTSKYNDDKIVKYSTANTSYSTAKASSSRKSITITGKKAGKTTVTITTASNETIKLSVKVSTPASEATVAKDIAKAEGNISGAVFARLKARTSSVKNTSITLKWNSVSTADGYIVYGNKCGTKYKFKKLATIKGSSKESYTKKSLSKGTYYKFIVLAYKNVDGKKVILSKSKTLHVVTGGNKSYANASSVKPAKTSVSVKNGKSYKLNATTVLPKGKKDKIHRSLAFESSNTEVATVTSKGVITGKKPGTCYVYVYAQNGRYYAVKVTVK